MGKLTSLKTMLQSQPTRLGTVNPDSWRTTKETASQRGYGYKWQKARAGWLEHHPLCEYCKREGRVTAATVVDHSIPHRGDMVIFWDRTKWVSLCTNCHSSVKQLEENADRSR